MRLMEMSLVRNENVKNVKNTPHFSNFVDNFQCMMRIMKISFV